MKYTDADKLVTEIERRKYEVFPTDDGKVRACSTPNQMQSGWLNALTWMLKRINSLRREEESVAERFAKIVRGNLIGIDEEVQQKFERLYFEVTGNKMYGGYND